MGISSALLFDAVCQDTESLTHNDGSCYEAALHLRKNLLKKFKESQNEATHNLAIEGFMVRHKGPERLVLPSLLVASGFCRHVLGDIVYSEIADGLRTGPGSSIGMEKESTSCYTKLSHSKSAVSSLELYKAYLHLTSEFAPAMYSAEVIRRKYYGFPTFAPYSNLITVPKNDTIDRVIAVEPTINSVMQQGVSYCLSNRLREVGIDLATQQTLNRDFARRGSLGHGFATVDFSAASDHLSDLLVRTLCGPNWFFLLEFVSTGAVKYEDDIITGNVRFSMGNATTFPLQTLLFLSLAAQVYHEYSIPFMVNKNVAVFGDDVIVLDRVAKRYMELSIECGLVPNQDKSFFEGEFRESCGSDWLRGVNIRSVYLRQLSSAPHLFVARNLLAAWSHRWNIPLDRSLDLIDNELCRVGHFCPVPMHAPLDSGVRIACEPVDSKRDKNGSIRYHYLRPTQVTRSARPYRTVHPYHTIQGYLGGGLKSLVRKRQEGVSYETRIVERQKTVRYGRVNNVTPHWGRVDPSDFWLYDVACTTSGGLSVR